MPNGTRATAGINTTRNQERYRGRGLENRIKSKTPEQLVEEWLKQALSEGPQPETEIRSRAANSHIDQLTLARVKIVLGVETVRGETGEWVWRMPEKPLEEEEGNEALKAAFAIDRTKPGEDEFTLTPEELKAFGIKETEDYCWVRDPRSWEDTRIAPGRIRQFQIDNEGARIITFKGDYVTCGSDLILATRPRKLVEQAQARDLQLEAEYLGHIEDERHEDDFDRGDRDALEELKRANTQANLNTGKIGPQSPSSGMPYEEYIRNRGLSLKDIEAEEMFHCFGHNAQDLDDEAAAAVTRQDRERRRDTGGKFISIPANVRPRNLMKGAA